MTRYLLGALAGFASVAVNAALLDFEAPLPGGLAPGSFWQDAPVLASGMITDHYADQGVIMSNVALVNLGSGHAWSGENGLSGISPAGLVDYRYDMVFQFVMPSDGATPATTDHFSVSGDRAGGSTNVVTLRGFDVDDNLLGSVSFTETGVLVGMTLEGIGQFHKVEISSTLYNTYNGGIGLDLVSFGDLAAIDDASAPEPGSLVLLGAGVVALVGRRRGGSGARLNIGTRQATAGKGFKGCPSNSASETDSIGHMAQDRTALQVTASADNLPTSAHPPVNRAALAREPRSCFWRLVAF